MDKHSITTLVQFLALRDELPASSDVIFALGSADLEVPRVAAEFWRQGRAPYIAVCGGIGRLTGALGRPEADAYADVLRDEGVPEESFLIENKSTNSGENVQFGMELAASRGWRIQSIILIQTPILQRRAERTFQRQYPQVKVYSWAPYIPERTPEVAELAFGEIERLSSYGPKGRGFIAEIDIPLPVQEAQRHVRSTIIGPVQ